MHRSRSEQDMARRRQLQRRISRLRRRLDRHVDQVIDRSMLLADWRGYVQRHPARALLAAAGVGVVLSGFVSRDRAVWRLGQGLCDLAAGASWAQIWQVMRAWVSAGESAVSDSGEEEGTSDEQ